MDFSIYRPRCEFILPRHDFNNLIEPCRTELADVALKSFAPSRADSGRRDWNLTPINFRLECSRTLTSFRVDRLCKTPSCSMVSPQIRRDLALLGP